MIIMKLQIQLDILNKNIFTEVGWIIRAQCILKANDQFLNGTVLQYTVNVMPKCG
jgi:hypothetical protein